MRPTPEASYGEENIITLDPVEHIRTRAGMYIGKLGDGQSADDGIYVLLKEVLDNSIDEFMMGAGKRIEVTISEVGQVSVRDYGRGIPLGKVVDVVSKMNTGGKYDSKAFQKSIGLNGVGLKAVNALSTTFEVVAVRDGQLKRAEFACGKLTQEHDIEPTEEKNGTRITFLPDDTIFEHYAYRDDIVRQMLKNYTYLNRGLTMVFNGQRLVSQNGLVDLLTENMTETPLYDIVHLEKEDLDIALTHCNRFGEDYIFSFVNGQYTTLGGTHQQAFRESIVKTLRNFYGKNFDVADIRSGLTAVISIRVQDPVFESQTKIKLGSKNMSPEEGAVSIRSYVDDFLSEQLDNYLHRNPNVADVIKAKILDNEKERNAISGVRKKAKEKIKKANIFNKKLSDCNIHLTDSNNDRKDETAIFITEGNSASGSISMSRDSSTQAVFSLRGKPKNIYTMKRGDIYKNEELFLLQAALGIVDSIDDLRYNKVIIATDADVDGMHIRLLLLTFFIRFYPEVINTRHLFILQTPLFRVRNKKRTIYCYSEDERDKAAQELGDTKDREITRFKGLGEINWQEFKEFIRPDKMRLDPVTMKSSDSVQDLLEFYMGPNTSTRQTFVIDNLVIEEDLVQ